jgi:hypothetical protein
MNLKLDIYRQEASSEFNFLFLASVPLLRAISDAVVDERDLHAGFSSVIPTSLPAFFTSDAF